MRRKGKVGNGLFSEPWVKSSAIPLIVSRMTSTNTAVLRVSFSHVECSYEQAPKRASRRGFGSGEVRGSRGDPKAGAQHAAKPHAPKSVKGVAKRAKNTKRR